MVTNDRDNTEYETRKIKLPSDIWRDLDEICDKNNVKIETVIEEMLRKCIHMAKYSNS